MKNSYNKEELVKLILSKEKGEIIAFEEIAKILGLNSEDEKEFAKLKRIMFLIKKRVIPEGYILKIITGVGYYILKTKQISGHCYHTYIKKAEKNLDKSKEILMYVREEEMSDTRKQEYYEVCELNQELINTVKMTKEASKYMADKEKFDNLED